MIGFCPGGGGPAGSTTITATDALANGVPSPGAMLVFPMPFFIQPGQSFQVEGKIEDAASVVGNVNLWCLLHGILHEDPLR